METYENTHLHALNTEKSLLKFKFCCSFGMKVWVGMHLSRFSWLIQQLVCQQLTRESWMYCLYFYLSLSLTTVHMSSWHSSKSFCCQDSFLIFSQVVEESEGDLSVSRMTRRRWRNNISWSIGCSLWASLSAFSFVVNIPSSPYLFERFCLLVSQFFSLLLSTVVWTTGPSSWSGSIIVDRSTDRKTHT
jgi:hypothetical protein